MQAHRLSTVNTRFSPIGTYLAGALQGFHLIARRCDMRTDKNWRLLGQGLAVLTLTAALAACGGSSDASSSDSGAAAASASAAGVSPSVSGTPPITVAADNRYSFRPTVANPAGTLLSFSIQNKPAWATFDVTTGELSGTPNASDAGTYPNILISASDGTSRLPAFSIQVTAPGNSPTSGSASASSASYLQTYPLPVPTKQYQIVETTAPLPFPQGSLLPITTTPGEFEPASFVLHSSEALTGITIQASSLIGPGGSEIPSSSVDIRLVKTWYQASDGNCSCNIGKYLIPELLVKDDALVITDLSQQKSFLRATSGGTTQYIDITTAGSKVPSGAIVQDASTLQAFSMAANTNKQVWLTVQVPTGLPAGAYTGTISVSASGKPATTLSLLVTVLPFVLSPSIIEQSIYYRAQLKSSCSTLDSDCKISAQMTAELIDMRDHGILYPTVYDSIDSSLLATRLSLMKNTGLPTDKIYQLGETLAAIGVNQPPAWATIVKQWQSIASANGWGHVYTYGWDEATGATFDSQLPVFDVIHANGGKVLNAVPNAATAVRLGIEKLDVVVQYGYGMLSSTIAQVHRTNSKVFMYGDPFTDFENPERVRNHFGFGLLYKGYDGAMNYAYQDGGRHGNDAWNDFWTNAPRGARNLEWTYPTTNGVVDTLQWEGYREAVDDIRYASTLAARKGWTKAQLVSYLRGLPTLAENPDLIDAPTTRQIIVDDILANQTRRHK